MPARKLKQFLDEHQVRYTSTHHSPAYTALEIAERVHIKGHNLAKTVMVNIDGTLAMVVIPAPWHLDLPRLKEALNANAVVLAAESEFESRFGDCEVGAMPPFGNLWDVPVYLADGLTENEEITFIAGTHTELIEVPMADYQRLVHPFLLHEGFQQAGQTPPKTRNRLGRNATHRKT